MPCAMALNGAQADWLTLVKAIGSRDGVGMAEAVSRLYANQEDRTGLRRRFLLAAGMLATSPPAGL